MTIRHAPVKVTCECGKVHSFDRAKVLERLGKARYKCAGCHRRFIVACTPVYAHHPETFWAIYLEDVPSLGDTQDIGIHTDGQEDELPERLQFTCRCGCRLVGEKNMFGRRTHCPKCQTRIIVRVGYHTATGKPVALLEYVPGTGTGETGVRPAVARPRRRGAR